MRSRFLRPLLATLACLAFLQTGCPRGESPRDLATQLAAAKTASAEAELFERIHRHRRGGLSLSALDREGHDLPMSEPEWWKKTHRLIITLDGERMDHVLLAPDNVFILMGE
ncbi:MAG: hypothetical protein U0235_25875 [Polyangiaceae bacterium]